MHPSGFSFDIITKLQNDLGFDLDHYLNVRDRSMDLRELLGDDWIYNDSSESNSVKAVSFSLSTKNIFEPNWVIHLPDVIFYRSPTPVILKNQYANGAGMIVFFKSSPSESGDFKVARRRAEFGRPL